MPVRSSFQASNFPTTRWSQVMVAREDHSSALAALNELCQKYWRPIYAFARHRGCCSHDAEDLTQSYFARLLERGYIHQADQAKGRFRAFLIHDFKFFLSNQMSLERAEKRGGNISFIPLDIAWAESHHEPADPACTEPEAYFDRQWALEIVRHARRSVAQSYEEQGKKALFDTLQAGLISTPSASLYETWERDLGMSAGALKVALHRLRERFRAMLEKQIMETVSSEMDLKAEMRHLRQALGQSQNAP